MKLIAFLIGLALMFWTVYYMVRLHKCHQWDYAGNQNHIGHCF